MPQTNIGEPFPVLVASAKRLGARFYATLTFAVGILFSNLPAIEPQVQKFVSPAVYTKIGAVLSIGGIFWLAAQRHQDTRTETATANYSPAPEPTTEEVKTNGV